ncbi:sensor domain-containing diguanylate cyclase [Curvibacter lanceolatus]|uniref:sensor domain-containing diguanylate cyclase n=1 Tax=Curvibacter lanceolatus TaxID=86182 RepID=UPI0012F9C4F1|nr:GGDEF domain-containing protein [Curvibacter lanceolatus]
MTTIRSRLSLARSDSYGVLLLLLLAIGAWLVIDFMHERDRVMAERSRLAINKSQLMNRSFGDTFLAADYVLRDVLGRVHMGKDLAYPQPDAEVSARLEALLKEKVITVAGLTDLVLFNGDCVFAATANYPTRGTKSRQRFCSDGRVEPGQSLHIQYMPPVNSASARPVVLMSRTVGSPEGVLLGGAMVVVDLEYAQQWITDIEVEQDDVLALVDSNGTLLARNPPLPEAIGLRTSPPPNEPSFSQVEDSATFTAVSPIDGRERIVGMSKLERLPFIVIVGFDAARVLSGWQHRAWQFAAGYIVLSALALMALRVQRATRRQREEMRQLANTDTLTGISNRRHLVDIADREFDRARRYSHPLSVLMLDIDKFKTINDRWGHPTGDRVIQALAQLTTSVIRGQDLCGRLGGDEFALLLPETDSAGAQLIAERLRTRAEASGTVRAEDGTVVRFTVSIGIASLSPEDASFDALLQRADKELYQAKQGGRNRSVLAANIAA